MDTHFELSPISGVCLQKLHCFATAICALFWGKFCVGEMLQGNHAQLMSNTQTEQDWVRMDTHFGWNPINGVCL